METPDITLVQKLVAAILAAASAILTVLTTFEVLTLAQAGVIGGALGSLGTVYLAADAVIRNGRSKIAAAQKAERPYDSAVGR